MTAPRADSGAYAQFLTQIETFLKNKDATPQAVFQNTVQLTLCGGHPCVRPLSPDLLKKFDLQEMLKIYRDRFADAGRRCRWSGYSPAAGHRQRPDRASSRCRWGLPARLPA